jgi:arsenical pump membrane protein
MFKVCIAIVALIRAGLFIGATFNIPIELIGIVGALLLIGYRWYRKGLGVNDIIKKTPWHIILFAFSIYVVVYGLHNIGLTGVLVELLRGPISVNHLSACLISGSLLTVMSNLFNNLPSVMIGTFTLVEMGLDTPTLQLAYMANIMGADIGSLITPMGTLATLIWIFLLRKNGISVKWADIMKVTVMVIPIGLLISLLSLYFWAEWLFF